MADGFPPACRSWHAALVFPLFLLAASAAFAAQLDEAQRLLDEQRARSREQQLQQAPAEVRREAAPAFDAGVEAAAVAETEPAFDIRAIRLKGDELFDAAEQEALLRPFLGLRLGANRINLLLRRLTAALIDKGYVTSRAYIGAQNLASGTLEVTLIAGRIEAVRMNGEAPSGGAWAALPFRPGEILRLPDLEQGVDQINRLRGIQAEMQILPGQSAGGSLVDLRTRVAQPWRLSLGADNYGQDSTGTLRGRVTVEADNPLGLFDAWTLTHIQSDHSQASLLSVSVPWGYSTLSYTYTLSDYATPIPGLTAVIAGDSSNHTLGFNRVLQRDAHGKTALDASLTLRRAQRDVAGIALTPQDAAVLRLAGSRVLRRPGIDLNAELGYSQGLTAFGADVDLPGLPATAPHAQFEKFDLNAAANLGLPGGFLWRSQLVAQYAGHGLLGTEQLFIGGAATVRGFKEGVLAGDRGAYMRHELAATTTFGGASLMPYAFFDYGRVRLLADPADKRLASVGLGLRLALKGLSAALDWGLPVTAPDGIEQRPRLHGLLTLQL